MSHPLPTFGPSTVDALKARLATRLTTTPAAAGDLASQFPTLSADELISLRSILPQTQIPAAVLVGLVAHEDRTTILLTERAGHLRLHAGQISFPGGRIEADEDAVMAALREAQEEIGLDPAHVTPLGFLPPQLVVSGFCIHPLVAVVQSGLNLLPDHNEVADVFEVPLTYLLDTRNHRPDSRRLGPVTVPTFDIVHDQHRIWGATAGIIRSLCRAIAAE